MQTNHKLTRPNPLAWVLIGSMLLASGLPAVAQSRTRKKVLEEEEAAPEPKKKVRPKTTPRPDSEEPSAGRPGIEEKPKAQRSTPTPVRAKKMEPEAEGAAPANSTPTNSTTTANASIGAEELVEFRAQPAGVRKLIESSLDLTRQNLAYIFGSAEPSNGGMDCSGFVYHVLRQFGLTQVPRDSSGQYVWARQNRGFRAVISRKPDSFEMDELLPGDLLFWIGTYATDHDPPISHVMIYLGTEKSTGNKVMVGSSDGRSYHGQKRNGVSVFDFVMPRTPVAGDQRSTFIGYARIPALRD